MGLIGGVERGLATDDLPVGVSAFSAFTSRLSFDWSQWVGPVGSDKIRKVTGWRDSKPMLLVENLRVFRLAHEAVSDGGELQNKVEKMRNRRDGVGSSVLSS